MKKLIKFKRKEELEKGTFFSKVWWQSKFCTAFLLTLLTFLGLFLWSCNVDDLQVLPPEEKKESPSQETDKVSDAIAFLNDVFVDNTLQPAAYGSNPTPVVSFDSSKIDTIYDLPDENKKPFLRLVVFKPKAYALISVIKGVKNPPVLFYGKEKFDVKNPNPGLLTYLQEFFANAARYARAPTPEEDKDGDGAWDDGRDRTKPKDPRSSVYYYKETVVRTWTQTPAQKHPLLNTNWKQKEPYNNTIAYYKGYGTLVGCVAVAVGQIMAYHKKNTHKNYNWSAIHQKNISGDDKTTKTEISNFLWDVAEGVKMKYGTSESGTNITDTAYYFHDSGYRISGWFNWLGYYVANDYDFNTVKNELDNNRPVFLSANACRRDWFFFYTYSKGHAWVADGYKIIEHYKRIKTDTGIHGSITYHTSNYRTKMIHMNWGWGRNKSDGWTTYDYWKASEKKDPNFKYKKEMITVNP